MTVNMSHKMTGAFFRCRSGAAAVEFAIIGMVFFVLCIGLVEVGRGLHLRNELSFAADVAARRILMDPATPQADVESDVRGAFITIDPSRVTVVLGSETVGGVLFRTVRLSLLFEPVIAVFGLQALTLNLNRRVPAQS